MNDQLVKSGKSSLIELINSTEDDGDSDEENKVAEVLKEKFKILYDYTENEKFVSLMRDYLSNVLEYIRFPILTPKEIYNFVEPCKIGSLSLF
jgi:hypothetical protein